MSLHTEARASVDVEEIEHDPGELARPQTDVRVNLLPKVVAERAKERRALRVGMALVAVSCMAVGAGWYVANSQIADANAQVINAKAAVTVLNQENARYADVPRVFQAVRSAKMELDTAMRSEVRWSYVLNDLSLITPQGVSLVNMTATSLDGTPEAANGTGTASKADQPVARVTWNGEATAFNGIAAWLDALAKLPTYSNPYFTASTRDASAGKVTFTSTADVTKDALSNRYVYSEGAVK
jgi:Tfp pilus assembly protein PilN